MTPFVVPLAATFLFAAIGGGVAVAVLAEGGHRPAAREAAATPAAAPPPRAAAAPAPPAVLPEPPAQPVLAALPQEAPVQLLTEPAWSPPFAVAVAGAAPPWPGPRPAPEAAPDPLLIAAPAFRADAEAFATVAPAAPADILAAGVMQFALAIAPPAQARPVLRICAGIPTGSYTFAAHRIADRLRDLLAEAQDIRVVHTAGSAENLDRLLSGECELGFSQADVLARRAADAPDAAALDPFKRVYTEQLHILCPVASGWSSTAQLGAGARVIVGAPGSGGAETWQALVRAAPRLAAVEAVQAPIDLVALNRVKDSRDTCLLWVAGPNATEIQLANRMSANTPGQRRTMRVLSMPEREILAARAPDGQPLYAAVQLVPRPGAYDALVEPARGEAASRGPVTLPAVEALLVARPEVLAMLPERGAEIVLAVEEAGPTIWARVSPPASRP